MRPVSNAGAPFSPDAEDYWSAKNGIPGASTCYVGGVEHAVLHLLYARFWHKVLYDARAWSRRKEPFQKLVNQGLLTASSYKDSTEDSG